MFSKEEILERLIMAKNNHYWFKTKDGYFTPEEFAKLWQKYPEFKLINPFQVLHNSQTKLREIRIKHARFAAKVHDYFGAMKDHNTYGNFDL